jgi:type VI secretion system protein
MGKVQRSACTAVAGKRVIAAVGLFLALATLSGCKTPSFLCFKSSGLGQIVLLNSDPSNNGGRPIAVDLVFVTDKKVLQAIAKLKASEYFALREQFRRDFTKGYEIQSWELTPGQFDGPKSTSAPCNLVGTLVFADYSSEGDHRISIGKVRSGTVVLGAEDLNWVPEKR